MAVMLITHDLAIVAGFARRVLVLYAGRVVEACSVDDLFHSPLHPYAWGLLGSLPRVDRSGAARLAAIPGQPPSATQIMPGCAFRPRCAYAGSACRTTAPELRGSMAPEHAAACHFAGELVAPPGLLPDRP